MRKLLASVATCALAGPALALAANASSQNDAGVAGGGPDRAITLRAKQRKANLRRERRRSFRIIRIRLCRVVSSRAARRKSPRTGINPKWPPVGSRIMLPI